MAIHLPSNLYSAGAVSLNSQPQVNLYAQLLAKQQAKKDALDQYYAKTLSDVTPTGMRNKDVTGGWAKEVNDWQTKYMNPEKRKFLQNPRLDDYKTVTEFNQEHQGLLNKSEKSKQLLKKETFVNQQRANAKRSFTEDDIKLMDRLGKSIYDDTRLDEMGNEPDETQLSINQPEFTPLQEKQAYQGAFQGIPKSKIPDNAKQYKKEGYIYTPFQKKFNPDQIKAGIDIYANTLSKSGLTHYEQIMHDQDIYDAATTAYQTVYGKDKLIDTPQKMAKGVAAIHALSEVEVGEDHISDWAGRNAITSRQAMSRVFALGSQRANSINAQKEDIEGAVDDLVAASLISPSRSIAIHPDYLEAGAHDIKVTPDGKSIQYESSKDETITVPISDIKAQMVDKFLITTPGYVPSKPKQKPPAKGKEKIHW